MNILKKLKNRIKEVIEDERELFQEEYPHETSCDSVAYGDTYVDTPAEPTEKSIALCDDEFVESFEVSFLDTVQDTLNNDDEYLELQKCFILECLEEMK